MMLQNVAEAKLVEVLNSENVANSITSKKPPSYHTSCVSEDTTTGTKDLTFLCVCLLK